MADGPQRTPQRTVAGPKSRLLASQPASQPASKNTRSSADKESNGRAVEQAAATAAAAAAYAAAAAVPVEVVRTDRSFSIMEIEDAARRPETGSLSSQPVSQPVGQASY